MILSELLSVMTREDNITIVTEENEFTVNTLPLAMLSNKVQKVFNSKEGISIVVFPERLNGEEFNDKACLIED